MSHEHRINSDCVAQGTKLHFRYYSKKLIIYSVQALVDGRYSSIILTVPYIVYPKRDGQRELMLLSRLLPIYQG